MPAINDAYKANFNTLLRAAQNKELAIFDAYDTVDKKSVVLLIAVADIENKEKVIEFNMTPLAVMIDCNPYERYAPADTNGGYEGVEK